MFDIGLWELVLISVVALVVLGPERLPHAIRSVTSFIRAAKSMANSVKDELSHELKVQELQENLRKAQEELASVEVDGSSGGGMVKIKMTCRHDIRKVEIDSTMMNEEDKEVLEDLIAAAVNDAVRKVEQTTQEKMAGLTGGMNIPGLNLSL